MTEIQKRRTGTLPLFIRIFLSLAFIAVPSSCGATEPAWTNALLEHPGEGYKPGLGDYMASLETPNVGYKSENLIKFDTIDVLPEYRDFNSRYLMELLVQRAANTSTPIEEFHKELKELIEHYQKNEYRRNMSFKYFTSGYYSKRIEALEKKYNVKPLSDCESRISIFPDTITYVRLSIMFPHFNDFRRENTRAAFVSLRPGTLCSTLFELLPSLMLFSEFGGLIPREESELPAFLRESIIRVHLLFSTCKEFNFHEETVLLKQRIEKSLLSDKRRISLLKEGNIILDYGQLDDAFYRVFEIIPASLGHVAVT